MPVIFQVKTTAHVDVNKQNGDTNKQNGDTFNTCDLYL